jgi:hypothetical protein
MTNRRIESDIMAYLTLALALAAQGGAAPTTEILLAENSHSRCAVFERCFR